MNQMHLYWANILCYFFLETPAKMLVKSKTEKSYKGSFNIDIFHYIEYWELYTSIKKSFMDAKIWKFLIRIVMKLEHKPNFTKQFKYSTNANPLSTWITSYHFDR